MIPIFPKRLIYRYFLLNFFEFYIRLYRNLCVVYWGDIFMAKLIKIFKYKNSESFYIIDDFTYT